MTEMLPAPGAPPRDIHKALVSIFHSREELPAPWQCAGGTISAPRGGQSYDRCATLRHCCAFGRDLQVHCPPPADLP